MKRLTICALLTYLSFRSQAGGQSGIVSAPAGPESRVPKSSLAQKAQLAENYGKLPLSFEANTGQADKSVKFLSRGGGYGLYLTGEEAVLALHQGGCAGLARRLSLQRREVACDRQTDVVRMRLGGASRAAADPAGEERLPGTANYFIGNDPSRWHTSVPTYSKVRYRGVYPGVDLVYYGNQRQLEYDFIVAPGADPRPIRLQFAGAKGLRLSTDGDLVVTAADGAMTLHKPAVYQVVDGQRKAVEGSFALVARHTVGFRLGSYDRAKALVIDPVLVYSTYLGGSYQDKGTAIAVDTAGNAYVAGYAYSVDFPVTQRVFQRKSSAAVNMQSNAFITKFDTTGSTLIYSAYLGGSADVYGADDDGATAVAVDSAGNAYIAGQASSTDFPVTPGAFQKTNYGGAENAFVTKLNPTGSALVYSTYLGGSGAAVDGATGLAVDGSGHAYVTGRANSTDFPVTQGAFQTKKNGASNSNTNVFVTKLDPAGSSLVYSTYLGGSHTDSARGLAVDGSGNAYITGTALSTDFPVTQGAFQTKHPANSSYTNPFVTKLNPTGSALVYSTYLGGSYADSVFGLAVDGSGNAYIVGDSASFDFPVTQGAFQAANSAGGKAFVTKLNPTGSALIYSTFLGGSGGDEATGLAVDTSGNAHVTGLTYSTDFPVTQGAFQATKSAAGYSASAFVTKLNSSGTALVYSTYLGGSGTGCPSSTDGASGLAVDGSGDAYITGYACSTDFPVTQGAFQTTNHSKGAYTNAGIYYKTYNAFVTKLDVSGGASASSVPSITPGGIVPVGSTVATIQPGEWVSIYGTNLASSTVTWNGDFPISLGGTSVTINGKAAYLSLVSPGQVNLQAPSDTAIGPVPVVVTTTGGSATATVTMAQFAPSFFLLDAKHVAGIILRSNGSGIYGGGTYDIIGPTGNSLGYATVAAKAGDTVELFAGGLGATNLLVQAGQAFSGAAPTTNAVTLQINNLSVTPAFAGLSGAGLYQINLTVPAGLGTGDVSLTATVGGAQTPSGAVISLQAAPELQRHHHLQ